MHDDIGSLVCGLIINTFEVLRSWPVIMTATLVLSNEVIFEVVVGKACWPLGLEGSNNNRELESGTSSWSRSWNKQKELITPSIFFLSFSFTPS